MTTSYNGNDGAVTPRAAVTITIPVDADPLTAAILNAAVKQLADICDHLETKAGLLDVASTWTTGQTFNAGMQSTGVSPSGSAAILTGGSPNGVALTATGTGTGAAVVATGGSSAGTGGDFTGGGTIQGNGVRGVGTGIGYGVVGVPGNSSSSAGLYSVSSNGAPALKVYNSSTGVAADIGDGYLRMSGANPASSDPFTSTLTPANICKAMGVVTWASGVFTVVTSSSFNTISVASSAPASGFMEFTFGGAAAIGFPAIVGIAGAGNWNVLASSTPGQLIVVESATGTPVDLSATSGRLHFSAHFRQ